MLLHGEGHKERLSMMNLLGHRDEDNGSSSKAPAALEMHAFKSNMVQISLSKRFLEGDLVEVRQREKGLHGAWFEGVIVGVLPGKRIVEYDELLTDDGSSKLRETIPVSVVFDGQIRTSLKSAARTAKPVIRPRPIPLPYPSPFSWRKGTWVDCWYEDAWWEGILEEDVTTVEAAEEQHLILTPKTDVEVHFPGEYEILKISIKNMRLTQDFHEVGIWSQREKIITTGNQPSEEEKDHLKNTRDQRSAAVAKLYNSHNTISPLIV